MNSMMQKFSGSNTQLNADMGMGDSPNFGGLGRKRRQSDDPLNAEESNLDSWDDNSRYTLPPDILNVSPVEGYQDMESQDFGNGAAGGEQMIEEFVKKLDPMFGYSFFTAWVGFVFALLAVVVTALTCRRKNPYSDDLQPVL